MALSAAKAFKNLMDTYLFRYPRRSCEALSSATLMLEPWPTNRIPPNLTLIELQDWISFLIQEEQDLRKNGVPHEYHLYPEEGHGFKRAENVQDFYLKADAFLRKYVMTP